MILKTTKGKVIIAGAGPGDPELISLKAVKWLQKADIILTDRLVSQDILNEYAPAKAEIIYVGKHGKFGLSTSQKTINQLIVDYSKKGKLVVRLKGGDVSIFANVLDELQTLIENDIPYELVPGISAAMGAAAYAGIPLTARNYANSVRFLTHYSNQEYKKSYWEELANTDDTLVFYMSCSNIEQIVENLKAAGITSDKHLAVVEQATTTMQNVFVSQLHRYKDEWKDIDFASPSLFIVGKVVALHEQFKWLQNSNSNESYFAPAAILEREAV